MRVNSVNNTNFKGKIKINSSEQIADVFAKRLHVLKNSEPKNELDVQLKKIADKMSSTKTYSTSVQEDGYSYILTDDDAEKIKSFSANAILHNIYTGKYDEKREELKLEKAKLIKKTVEEAEPIGEIKCAFEVIG